MIRTLALIPLLTACGSASIPWGSTHADFQGSICGADTVIELADGKARQNFTLNAVCSDGTTVEISSTESTVEGQQAAADVVKNSFDLVNSAIERLGPLWTGPRLTLPE